MLSGDWFSMRIKPIYKILAVAVTFAAIVAFSACSMIAKRVIEKPNVKLARVDLRDVNAAGATVVFVVEVDNPNPFALKVDSVRYNIEIGGKPLSTGHIDSISEVPAKSTGLVEVPIPVRFADLFSSVLDFLQNGTSKYHIKGEASVGILSVPFDESGELNIKGQGQ
jgi:LEA14-like dessication related protein